VDAEFRRSGLDANGIVVDIGLATTALHDVLAGLNYRNLDDDPSLAGGNTTTEVLARVIFDRIAAAIRAGRLGTDAANIDSLRITLNESHVASAGYEGQLR
jgi:6-pyruvoyl-tetrahydropterin synthase